MLTINLNNGEEISDWCFMEETLPAFQKEIERIVKRDVKIEYAPLLGAMIIPDTSNLAKTYGCSVEELPSEQQELAKQLLGIFEEREIIQTSIDYLEVSEIADLCLCCTHPEKIYVMGKFRFAHLNTPALQFYVYVTSVKHKQQD